MKFLTQQMRSYHDTLYLLSIPNMRKSVKQGLKVPLTKCNKKFNWPTPNGNK